MCDDGDPNKSLNGENAVLENSTYVNYKTAADLVDRNTVNFERNHVSDDTIYHEVKMVRSQNVNNMIIGHLNVNSLGPKIGEIKKLQKEGKIDTYCHLRIK